MFMLRMWVSGWGEAVRACERGAFVNAGIQNGEMYSGTAFQALRFCYYLQVFERKRLDLIADAGRIIIIIITRERNSAPVGRTTNLWYMNMWFFRDATDGCPQTRACTQGGCGPSSCLLQASKQTTLIKSVSDKITLQGRGIYNQPWR